jgi:hypothetical protein
MRMTPSTNTVDLQVRLRGRAMVCPTLALLKPPAVTVATAPDRMIGPAS